MNFTCYGEEQDIIEAIEAIADEIRNGDSIRYLSHDISYSLYLKQDGEFYEELDGHGQVYEVYFSDSIHVFKRCWPQFIILVARYMCSECEYKTRKLPLAGYRWPGAISLLVQRVGRPTNKPELLHMYSTE